MAIQTRTNRLAVVVESTEGTPVAPSGGSDFIAIQDDLAVTAEFETLENAELTGSLGPAKPILGLENPAVSFSHYLRHSGTEGTAPGYGELLKAAFGTEDDAGVEHNTVGGSTTTVINVDTGEGATYLKGQPLLIKDGTNGFSIRHVESISSDALTLGFALDNAPASGVDLGEAITYLPADADHQTLTIWQYVGNGGATQMVAGNRVTEVSISMEAGQLINASYSLEGIQYFFDPIEIAAADIYLDFTDDGGTFAAQITAKMYKDPHELASALQTAMNTVQTAETHSVTYSDTDGKFTIATSTSAVLSLLWNTGTNAANTVGDKLGFSVAADDTGATTYESDSAQSFASPFTPSFDSADPLVAKNMTVRLGGQSASVCFPASSISATIGTPKTDILSVCAVSGKSGSIVNERTVEVEVVALLEQYDADKFRRFRENTETRFQATAGEKVGGNWVAGKNVSLYLPSATISSFEITDEDGLATLNMTLSAFVNSNSEAEVALGMV